MNGSTNAEVMTTDTASALSEKENTIQVKHVILSGSQLTSNYASGTIEYTKYGRVCVLNLSDVMLSSGGYVTIANLPDEAKPWYPQPCSIAARYPDNAGAMLTLDNNGALKMNGSTSSHYYGQLVYFTN